MHLDNNNFEETLSNNSRVLVDFWADWCGPCLKLSPILDEIASEYDILIGKVHVDEQTDLAAKYEVSSIPTLVMFENGVPVKRMVGAQPKHKLLKEFEGWI